MSHCSSAEAGIDSLPGTRHFAVCHLQGRGKSGLDQQQLEAFDAAVAVLEEDGGLKVQAAGHVVMRCLEGRQRYEELSQDVSLAMCRHVRLFPVMCHNQH